jgi:phosphoribosylformylglycinamidine cyclo-ligase
MRNQDRVPAETAIRPTASPSVPARLPPDSYATAGVDTGQADRAVDALVGVLRTIELDRPSASVLPSGHYASVLRVARNLGIALSTDGVGSKIVVAEQADRLETVGIDCVAMNVNDLVCVGAEPIAMLDYLAVEQADPDALARIGVGLKVGAQAANVEIPGGELAVLPELIRGHPSPHGFDLCGTAFGTVALDEIVTGAEARPGDAMIGLPSSGLHSNGYTLARRALLDEGGLSLEDRPAALDGRSVADALLEPTVIYVRAALELLRSDIPVHGLAHITGGGLRNLLRLGSDRLGFAVEEPLPVPPICSLVAEMGNVPTAEMWDVFNMGCGFVALVPDDRAEDAAALVAAHHPGSARIGTVTGDAGQLSLSRPVNEERPGGAGALEGPTRG